MFETRKHRRDSGINNTTLLRSPIPAFKGERQGGREGRKMKKRMRKLGIRFLGVRGRTPLTVVHTIAISNISNNISKNPPPLPLIKSAYV